jgi:hypothetical protein
MIVELLASGMVKNLNLLVDYAFGEGLNGIFKTNWREEKPIIFGFDLASDLMRNNL